MRDAERCETAERRPLILAASARLRVEAQAASLLVRREPAGAHRFPISRIDRVVCGTAAAWSGEALALCFQNGVTITWVDGRGNPLADLLPRLASASTLNASLDRFLELPGWSESYGNWLRRRRMAVLKDWFRDRQRRGAEVDRGEYETWLRSYVNNGKVPGTCVAEMFGWCRAVAAARLTQAGLRVRYWARDGQPMELAEDIAGLLWAALNLEYGRLGSSASGTPAAARAFEASTRKRTEDVAEHLAQLNAHVCRALEAWR